MRRLVLVLAAAYLALPLAAQAQAPEGFTTGPVFEDFGPKAMADYDVEIPEGAEFAVAFDVIEAAEEGRLNSGLEGGARFINMLVANGVPEENIRIAIVTHGPVLRDLLTDEARAAHDWGQTNPSGDMVREMLAHGVRFIVCGQSAAASGIAKEEFIPGVELALSAMTAHALLQQQGYTLNPF